MSELKYLHEKIFLCKITTPLRTTKHIMRDPVLLPCGYSVCYKCLKYKLENENSVWTCDFPECTKQHKIENVDKLTKNGYLINVWNCNLAYIKNDIREHFLKTEMTHDFLELFYQSIQIINKAGLNFTLDFDDLTNLILIRETNDSIVFKCEHEPSKMFFTIKSLKGELKDCEKIIKENLFMTKHDCSNIMKFYGILYKNRDEGNLWILAEYLDASLDRFCKSPKFSQQYVTELFLSKVAFSVLNGLKFIFEVDGKNANVNPFTIFVNYNGEIKLIYPMLKIDARPSNRNYNLTHATDNTYLTYRAPELFKNNPQKSIQSDIWSLGITLYVMATGTNPYEDYLNDQPRLINEILLSDSPKLSDSEFNIEFCSFMSACLKKEPAERSTIEELLEHKFIQKYSEEKLNLNHLKDMIDDSVSENTFTQLVL